VRAGGHLALLAGIILLYFAIENCLEFWPEPYLKELGYENFQIYPKWNQSLSYCITAAHLAMRLAGAPPFSRGSAQVPDWSFQQMKELQQLLVRRGFTVGEVDGKLGAATRAGVKAAQMKLGLPADSYPTPDLLERLRAGR